MSHMHKIGEWETSPQHWKRNTENVSQMSSEYFIAAWYEATAKIL